jgi:hypothetical protein
MVQSGSGEVSQIDWEELDNKGIIIRSTSPARKPVVLQPDAGVSLGIILDDVARRSETPREAGVTHGASKRLRAKPFRTEVASFTIVVASTAWFSCALLGQCTAISWVMPSIHLRF